MGRNDWKALIRATGDRDGLYEKIVATKVFFWDSGELDFVVENGKGWK